MQGGMVLRGVWLQTIVRCVYGMKCYVVSKYLVTMEVSI